MFEYIENVLPIELAEKIHANHFEINKSDKSSYDHWNSFSTCNNTLPEVYIELLPKNVVLDITTHLYNDPDSPFYGDKLIRNTDGAVQKYPSGSMLPMHRDSALYSVTIFLNKEWSAEDGGQFIWQDEDTNILNVIQPKFNCGIFYKGSMDTKSPYHGMPVNLSQNTRVGLQLFTWKPSNTANPSGIFT
jgi:Rps23 Pro-64 3,4-dihydroxylase Tpa1-like proline 4-hydroxylase